MTRSVFYSRDSDYFWKRVQLLTEIPFFYVMIFGVHVHCTVYSIMYQDFYSRSIGNGCSSLAHLKFHARSTYNYRTVLVLGTLCAFHKKVEFQKRETVHIFVRFSSKKIFYFKSLPHSCIMPSV